MMWLKDSELNVCPIGGCLADTVHYHTTGVGQGFKASAIPCYCAKDHHYHGTGGSTACMKPRSIDPLDLIDTTEATVAVLTPSPWRK